MRSESSALVPRMATIQVASTVLTRIVRLSTPAMDTFCIRIDVWITRLGERRQVSTSRLRPVRTESIPPERIRRRIPLDVQVAEPASSF